MNKTREELPKFDFKDIPLMGTPVKIKLDCAAPVKSGMGGFGKMWNLWFGYVTNQKVSYGKGKEIRVVENYTGKVLLFPDEYTNSKLIEICAGNVEVEVEVSKIVVESGPRIFKNIVVKKLSEGRKASSGSLTESETKLISDCENILRKGYSISEEMFITVSKDTSKYTNISEQRAKELYRYFKRD